MVSIEVTMNQAFAIVLGAVCGVIGAIPSAVLFERANKRGTNHNVSVGAGLATTLVSFLLLSAAIYVAHLRARAYEAGFGIATVVAFLVVWGVESIRGLRAVQGSASPGGKDE